jgi:protein SCO1/2
MTSANRIAASALILICILPAACRSRSDANSSRFELNGKVISVDAGQRRVTVAHQEIPGFMPAMTMPFAVKEDWAFSVLAPGQTLKATLVVENGRSWLEGIMIIQNSPVDSAGVPAPGPSEPEPGAEVPDFKLTNQDGGRIHLHQYRGQALLITFIYTRCPLPDYCPRMSSNFAQIQAALRKDPGLQSRVHLLSVSFDTEFDTPQILRGYGEAYAGSPDTAPFRHWEFATGAADEVKKLARFFGLEYTKDSGQIVHTLRTALIGTDGKLVRLYRGNDWTPAEVLDQIWNAAQRSAP